MYKRSIRIAIVWTYLLLMLSGCWDNKDINHRIMPVVLGIALEDGNYKAFLEIPYPKEDTFELRIVSAVGNSLNQVMEDMSKNLESDVDLLHVKVIIIEKGLAEEGVKDLFAGFMRSRDLSPKALVAISENDLDDFFTAITHETNPDGTGLLDCFEKNAGWGPQIALTRVWQVYRSIHSYTQDVAIPIIKLGSSTDWIQVGSAVIKNGRMVGQISSDETLLYNAFQGEGTYGKIEVLGGSSVLIIGDKMNHRSKMENSTPNLQSNIRLKVMLLETRGDPTVAEIKKELELLLTQRFNDMFTMLQTNEADILAIGQLFRKNLSRDELKTWRSGYFPRLNMDLNVQVEIQNTGNLISPKN
ncbi:Ger(x)C family spore germination protein [Sutcliffiella halmapala]|uniref:Ger(x)C family spore germination protein n=1 Tax=Sutcliffiella halmapala TaxID=79882 RepID=UPI001F472F15|nr:Ger(x)C family spore germination protein [Sutcliffiella halmapala]